MFGIDRANETWTVLLRRPAGAASAEPRLRQSAATAIAKRSIPKPLLLQLERGHWGVASTLPPSVILLQPRRNQCTPEPARRFRTWQCHCRLCLLCSCSHTQNFPARRDTFQPICFIPSCYPILSRTALASAFARSRAFSLSTWSGRKWRPAGGGDDGDDGARPVLVLFVVL